MQGVHPARFSRPLILLLLGCGQLAAEDEPLSSLGSYPARVLYASQDPNPTNLFVQPSWYRPPTGERLPVVGSDELTPVQASGPFDVHVRSLPPVESRVLLSEAAPESSFPAGAWYAVGFLFVFETSALPATPMSWQAWVDEETQSVPKAGSEDLYLIYLSMDRALPKDVLGLQSSLQPGLNLIELVPSGSGGKVQRIRSPNEVIEFFVEEEWTPKGEFCQERIGELIPLFPGDPEYPTSFPAEADCPATSLGAVYEFSECEASVAGVLCVDCIRSVVNVSEPPPPQWPCVIEGASCLEPEEEPREAYDRAWLCESGVWEVAPD